MVANTIQGSECCEMDTKITVYLETGKNYGKEKEKKKIYQKVLNGNEIHEMMTDSKDSTLHSAHPSKKRSEAKEEKTQK